jgi:hypothetical protein
VINSESGDALVDDSLSSVISMGRRQAVSQQILDLPLPGSNPGAPVRIGFNGLLRFENSFGGK